MVTNDAKTFSGSYRGLFSLIPHVTLGQTAPALVYVKASPMQSPYKGMYNPSPVQNIASHMAKPDMNKRGSIIFLQGRAANILNNNGINYTTYYPKSVFVISCCATNDPKSQQIQATHVVFHNFCGSGIQSWLSWTLQLWVSYEALNRCQCGSFKYYSNPTNTFL